MFGARFAPILFRSAVRITSQPIYVPKFEYSLLNKFIYDYLDKQQT